jgi:hypothetical protein
MVEHLPPSETLSLSCRTFKKNKKVKCSLCISKGEIYVSFFLRSLSNFNIYVIGALLGKNGQKF